MSGFCVKLFKGNIRQTGTEAQNVVDKFELKGGRKKQHLGKNRRT